MKDIVISGRRILRELLIFSGCFVAALAVNVYSIVRFGTEWKELFTTLHITLAIAGVFFVVLALLRAVFAGGRRVLRRRAG
jgi:uncharacterized Tic20 family protein